MSASYRQYYPYRDPSVLPDEEPVLDLHNRKLYLGTCEYEVTSLFSDVMGDITDAPDPVPHVTGIVVMIDNIPHGYAVSNFPPRKGH